MDKVFPKIVRIITTREGSNIYLIGNELLIDSGLARGSEKLIEVLKKINAKPKLLVNTHLHHDHCGGNYAIKKLFSAQICMHASDAQLLSKNHDYALSELFGEKFTDFEIDRRVSEGEIIKASGMEFKIIHTPGHTPGSICLWEKSRKLLISGDTFFGYGIGRTDLPGGSEKELFNSLKKLSKLDAKILLPGHGNVIKGDINKFLTHALREYF